MSVITEKTFIINLSEEEIGFLVEALNYGKMNYEDRASKYCHKASIPDYYTDVYVPTRNQYDAMRTKLLKSKE